MRCVLYSAAFAGSPDSCGVCSLLSATDPLPVDQMYHNDFAEVPGKLTVPRSKRTTSQLEGYHGAALNHVVCGFNTSAELALPQLTLTNNAWNLDRLVSVHMCGSMATKSASPVRVIPTVWPRHLPEKVPPSSAHC